MQQAYVSRLPLPIGLVCSAGSRQQAEAEQAAQVRELRLELSVARSQIEQLQEENRRAR